jgi:regulator of RNase E activity RraA
VGQEAWAVGVDDIVRAEGRHDAAGPTGLAETLVRLERIEGTVRRGEERDAEALEECARPVVGLEQPCRDLVVHGIGILGAQWL